MLKRRGPSNTTHWQHSFSDLAILTPREFCLYEYMKKCYWDLAVLFETGLPESLCQILPESLKLDPAGFSFKMQTFFDFFLAFLCKIYILDCNKGAWSRKTKKNWIWAVPGLSGQKSNFGLNNGRPRIFFSIFLFRTNENKICSSEKKVFCQKNAFFGQKRHFFKKFILYKNVQWPKTQFFSVSKIFFWFLKKS